MSKIQLKQLKELATINSGISFRGKVEGSANGEVGVIQVRDLADGYTRITSPGLRLRIEDVKSRHLLKEGDLLFLSKGSVNHSALYSGLPKLAVATSVFFIIRPGSSQVASKFLQWFLNQEKTQSYFKINQSGTYTPAVSKEVLGNLEIPLPDIMTQEKIAHLYSLEQKEQQLLSDIRDRRSIYLNSVLLESLNE